MASFLDFFTSLLGVGVVGFYFYVLYAFYSAERKTGAGYWVAFTKAAVWPATIFSTHQKLLNTRS